MNSGNKEKLLDTARYAERIGKSVTGYDIPTGAKFDLQKNLVIRPMSMLVLNLKP
jgi:hypothetical protein